LATRLWRIQRWYLAGSENGPLHRAPARTHRTPTFKEKYIAFLKEHGAHLRREIPLGCLGYRARSYRTLRDGSRVTLFQGTSCLATISLSLRDKNHPPIEAPRIILALMRLQPRKRHSMRRAIKGHQIERTNNAELESNSCPAQSPYLIFRNDRSPFATNPNLPSVTSVTSVRCSPHFACFSNGIGCV
jgi:hypothetical protein